MHRKKKNKKIAKNRPVKEQTPLRGSRKLLWALISVVLAAVSIWAVSEQAKNFSFRSFMECIADANKFWLAAAVLAMLGFIGFEACALCSACKALGYPTKFHRGFLYSSSDIYFSAITPSAIGGQPACAFLMMRNGIPGSVATAVLLLNLAMYSSAILVIGLIGFLLRTGVFPNYNAVSKILIIIGYICQIVLAFVFLMLVKNEHLLENICTGAINVLGRLKHIKDKEKKLQNLRGKMEEYRLCTKLLAGQKPLLAKSFLFNLLQRVSQLLVTVFVYMASGGRMAYAPDVLAMQSYAVIGSNCVPIPGAIGVTDYLMIDGLNAVLPSERTVEIELLSRSLSFYSCILLCGIVVLFSCRFKKKGTGK